MTSFLMLFTQSKPQVVKELDAAKMAVKTIRARSMNERNKHRYQERKMKDQQRKLRQGMAQTREAAKKVSVH